MNCRSCLKINAVPQCFEDGLYGDGSLFGIVMPDADTDYIVELKDVATSGIKLIEVTSDDDGFIVIPMTDIHLMNHVYEIRVLDSMLSEQILFELEGTPACCLEFETIENLNFPVTEFTLSAVVCTTE